MKAATTYCFPPGRPSNPRRIATEVNNALVRQDVLGWQGSARHLARACIELNTHPWPAAFINAAPLVETRFMLRGERASSRASTGPALPVSIIGDALPRQGYPQMCTAHRGTTKLRSGHPQEAAPTIASRSAGAENINVLLSEFQGTCRKCRPLKHAVHQLGL